MWRWIIILLLSFMMSCVLHKKLNRKQRFIQTMIANDTTLQVDHQIIIYKKKKYDVSRSFKKGKDGVYYLEYYPKQIPTAKERILITTLLIIFWSF